MTEAIISDFTGKTVNKKLSYKVQINSRSTNTHIEFDGSIEDLKNNKIFDSIGLALKNGASWYKLLKVDGKWIREEVEETEVTKKEK